MLIDVYVNVNKKTQQNTPVQFRIEKIDRNDGDEIGRRSTDRFMHWICAGQKEMKMGALATLARHVQFKR